MTIIQDYIFFFKRVCNINRGLEKIFVINVLSAFLYVIVALSVPYALKITVDILSRPASLDNAHKVLGVVLLYCIIWTANQILQWVRTLLSAPLMAKCDAASQILLYLHLIKIRYETIKAMDVGLLNATITRCRTAFSALSFTFLWAVIPVIFQVVLGSVLIFTVLGILPGIIILVSVVILLISSLHFFQKQLEPISSLSKLRIFCRYILMKKYRPLLKLKLTIPGAGSARWLSMSQNNIMIKWL